ncbi:MAG: hypothetical protein JXR07_17570 [Reichenbachiella sp.]
MIRVPFIILTLFLTNTLSYSQKVFKSKGEAHILMESNQSRDDTKLQAKNEAIINAIENAVGTYIERETNMDLEDGEITFKMVGSTKVKGEWLKTLDIQYEENTRSPKGENVEIWITCKITGNVREIIRPKLNFELESLNCLDKRCRTKEFLNNEDLFIYFKSPSSGFISIYIKEEESVYRLLPYSDMSGEYINSVPVIADKEYIYFSTDEKTDYFDNFSSSRVDELVMSTDAEMEYLTLYVVFSLKPFTKPILQDGKLIEEDYSMPKSLSERKFTEWISDNRIHNIDFNYDVVQLRIKGD